MVLTALLRSSTHGAEAAGDQDLLLGLLASGVSATVTLAARSLQAVHKAGLLDAAAFVDACQPALEGTKSSAVAVLQILAGLRRREPALAPRIDQARVVAMSHPHTDVQTRAVSALVADGAIELARASAEILAPSVRSQVLPGDQVPEEQLDSAVPLAPASAPLEPWTNQDAADRCAALLEMQGPIELEIELFLAWLSTTEEPHRALEPLVPRAVHRPDESLGHLSLACELVLTACDDDRELYPPVYGVDGAFTEEPPEDGRKPVPGPQTHCCVPGLLARAREVLEIIRGRRPRHELLATPTDSQGWVDTAMFHDRLAAAHRAGAEPGSADLAQALCRVHPEDRQACAQAAGVAMPRIASQITTDWRQSTRCDIDNCSVVWFQEAGPEQLSALEPALVPGAACSPSRRRTTEGTHITMRRLP